VPRGRVIEIFGPESSGKTTLALHVIARRRRPAASRPSSTPSTRSTPTYASKLGVDIDDLLVSQPDNGEQALEIVEVLVRSGAVDVVVVDSVAALVPRAEIEGEMGDAQMGLQARLMSQALRKLTGASSPVEDLPDLHQPAPREDRRHVRQPRDDDGRPRAEVLRVGPHRHPPDRRHQGRRRRWSATARA
jgi:recombination protein RecA